jgi:glutamyl-tRNA reductase
MTRNGADGLLMVGLSHRRASLDLRERVVVRPAEVADVLLELRTAGYGEAVVLSTCSRTEIYALAGPEGRDDILRLFERRAGANAAQVRGVAQVLSGGPVVPHLFRVTAGFCSPVLGEVDVHGQVRTAYRTAKAAGMTGPIMERLFPAALQCSTEVRERTGLAAHGRSLARRAVEVGLHHFQSAQSADPRILVVGSGQMARTAVEHLHALGLFCRVAARDEDYAARLVGHSLVCPLPALVEEIGRSDVLICATSAAQPVVTHDHVRQAMDRRRSPLTIVDLAIPRNVDTAVAAVDGVRLIDLTGLNDEATHDPVLRAAFETGNETIGAAARAFLADIAVRDAGPVIAALRRLVEDTCVAELTVLAAPGTSSDELVRAARAVAGKLLHPPTLVARQAAVTGDTGTLRMLCDTYGVLPGLEA